MNDNPELCEYERWELRHYVREGIEKPIDMFFSFPPRTGARKGDTKMAVYEHDIEVNGPPLVVKVAAAKAGKRIDIPLRVTNVSFEPDNGNFAGELGTDGMTIDFTATAEEETTATIEAEYTSSGGKTGMVMATLTLRGVPPAEEVPDTLELEFPEDSGGGEEPPPPGPGPAEAQPPAPGAIPGLGTPASRPQPPGPATAVPGLGQLRSAPGQTSSPAPPPKGAPKPPPKR